ncbi:MAG: LD-carboxypeptidase [Rhodoferax sp.]|nr:LD-carboxypeptidase [Rhodoferax sp.]
MKKHVYIYSPSGAVRDKAAFRRGIKRLEALGHEVEVDQDALESVMRFAGDDATRLRAIQRACDSSADIAMISRGGYGLTRILPNLPYAQIDRAVARGMQFVGISDFTALQLAVLAKKGTVTWAGPALCEGFGVGGASGEIPDDIMEDCFQDLLSGQGEGTGWRQSKGSSEGELSVRNAMVWGGNLTVLTSLMGTPYFPNVRGGILFLEDIAEHPYRIERMLTQLLHAGVLAKQKAIVLGQFTGYQLSAHDRGFKLSTVVAWLQTQIQVPVLTNLPYGHVQTKVLLPVGKKAELASDGKDVMLFWGH